METLRNTDLKLGDHIKFLNDHPDDPHPLHFGNVVHIPSLRSKVVYVNTNDGWVMAPIDRNRLERISEWERNKYFTKKYPGALLRTYITCSNRFHDVKEKVRSVL